MYHNPPAVAKLATETLTEIFLLATHSVDDDNPDTLLMSMHTPWRLTQVNARWRLVGRELPALWTRIYICGEQVQPDLLKDDDSDQRRRYTDFLKKHLSLSLSTSTKPMPLDIFIEGRDPDWDTLQILRGRVFRPILVLEEMTAVITTLLLHSARWRSIVIYTDEWAPMYTALKPVQASIVTSGAPLLEALTLMQYNSRPSGKTRPEPSRQLEPFFLKMHKKSPESPLPRLLSLTLKGVHVEWASLATILRSSPGHLKALEISWQSTQVLPTLSELYQILRASSQLETLTFRDDVLVDLNFEPEDYPAAQLPGLRRLTLAYRTIHEAETILELIDAPNLKVLALENMDNCYYSDSPKSDNRILSYIGTGSQMDLHGIPFVLERTPKPQSDTSLVESWTTRVVSTPSFTPHAMFPLVEELTLQSIHGDLHLARFFLAAFPNLRSLETFGGSNVIFLEALLPIAEGEISLAFNPCCCPQLESLRIDQANPEGLNLFIPLAERFVCQRPSNNGESTLKTIELYTGERGFSEPVATRDVSLSLPGSYVKFIETQPQDDDMDDEDEGE